MYSVQEITELVKKACPDMDMSAITSTSNLIDHGFDSMDIASIMLEIELTYQKKVSNEELTKLKTIEDITKYLNSNK